MSVAAGGGARRAGVLIQLFVLPIFFLSGALFPLTRPPSWIGVLTCIDPLTYTVDATRRTGFDIIGSLASAVRELNPVPIPMIPDNDTDSD